MSKDFLASRFPYPIYTYATEFLSKLYNSITNELVVYEDFCIKEKIVRETREI